MTDDSTTTNGRADDVAQVFTERELAYLSRAVFRQRTDKPEDEPELASSLDPLLSVARFRVIPA